MPAPNHPLEGRRLGDFLVGREVGRGGMGVVYEAEQVSLHRRVALKVLSSAVGLTPKAVVRFRREAEAAAKLHHTNIVPVYATGEQDGVHFYAMEYIDGPSLDRVVRQLRRGPAADAGNSPDPLAATGPYVAGGPSSASGSGLGGSSPTSGGAYFDAVAGAVAGVADALDHAHREGVVHRDVKPSNLLLAPSGRLSVNDFGLARMLEQPGMTITGEMVGTPMYMSPEQITAGRIPVDHRTDIYSLGATLYEMLTLEPPFRGEQRDQLLAQVIQKEPRPPRVVNPKVPVDLETICLKAMDKDPDRRYQTAGEMADDLRRYVSRFAILARRTGPLARMKKWLKRNPALSAALAAVLLCAAAAGGLAYRGHLAEQKRAEERARLDAELLEEKRRSVMEKAITMAYVQNFEDANRAIREAENLGCAPGQLRMLRGQLELYQGQNAAAIEHLTRATELLPESVAAWGLLAVALNNSGSMADYHRALGEAVRRPALTPEDYLFRGHAESLLDPVQGLKILDESVRLRQSALARLIRADVLRMYVLDTWDLDKAKFAMAEVQNLKWQFGDNPMVLSVSNAVHLTCYLVFGGVGQSELQQAALAIGVEEAAALGRFPTNPRAVMARWQFLKETGRADSGFADLRHAADRTGDLYVLAYYCNELYIRGEFDQATKVLEGKGSETVFDALRITALAETPDGVPRANKACDAIASRDPGEWDRFNYQLILRLLGRKPEAVEISRRYLKQPDRFPPVRKEAFQRALEYCAGERTADNLIASMGGNRGDLCNAYLCVALTALADGDRPAARRYLELCVSTRHYEFFPYDFSKMLLSRMNRDKDGKWPPWIPAAK